MKIAFLVLNHRPPAQLVRLLSALRSQLPDAPILVHHDVHHGELPSELIEPIGNVRIVASGKPIIWADYSVTEAFLWSLGSLREHFEFDWMVVLSGQDYPIKPLAGLADELNRSGADAVFRGTPINQLPIARRMLMRRRYYFQYRTAAENRMQWLSAALRGPLRPGVRALLQAVNNIQPLLKIYLMPDQIQYRLGWRARKTPFDRSFPCWHASSWFALSRDALEYVLNYLAAHPEYVDHYRGTMNADESMLATLVFNSPGLRVANRDITYMRWPNPLSAHPDVFRAADLTELTGLAQFFARKFDIAVDEEILDKLDEYIGVPSADRN